MVWVDYPACVTASTPGRTEMGQLRYIISDFTTTAWEKISTTFFTSPAFFSHSIKNPGKWSGGSDYASVWSFLNSLTWDIAICDFNKYLQRRCMVGPRVLPQWLNGVRKGTALQITPSGLPHNYSCRNKISQTCAGKSHALWGKSSLSAKRYFEEYPGHSTQRSPIDVSWEKWIWSATTEVKSKENLGGRLTN